MTKSFTSYRPKMLQIIDCERQQMKGLFVDYRITGMGTAAAHISRDTCQYTLNGQRPSFLHRRDAEDTEETQRKALGNL